MRVIYSYKILKKYWKNHSDDFFTLAKLSSALSTRLYDTTLYTDTDTSLLFKQKGIEFNNVVILDSLNQVTENNYGLAKILAMQEQTEPYIILDLDTLLFEPINFSNTITYGYKEISPDTLVGVDYIQEQYIKFFNLFKDGLKINTQKIDWSTYPNNSLVQVNNPTLISNIYQDILKILNGRFLQSSVQYYEQKLLYDYLADYNVDINFIYPKPPIMEMQLEEYRIQDIIAKKFVHLDFYFRQEQSKQIVKELLNFYS